jgi:hypothetical protein
VRPVNDCEEVCDAAGADAQGEGCRVNVRQDNVLVVASTGKATGASSSTLRPAPRTFDVCSPLEIDYGHLGSEGSRGEGEAVTFKVQ